MFKLLIALAIFNSCGTRQTNSKDMSADEKANQYIDEKSRGVDVKYKQDLGNPKDASTFEACSVLSVISLTGVEIVQRQTSWADAINNPPVGKRLATRGELILLWDQGYFIGKHAVTNDVWSSTGKNADEAYTLDLSTGQLDYSAKYNILGVVYVDVK